MHRTPALSAVAEAHKILQATELQLKRAKGEWEIAGSTEQGPEWDALQMAQEHFETARDNWLLEENRVRGRV
jgi:hypothetical protein